MTDREKGRRNEFQTMMLEEFLQRAEGYKAQSTSGAISRHYEVKVMSGDMLAQSAVACVNAGITEINYSTRQENDSDGIPQWVSVIRWPKSLKI